MAYSELVKSFERIRNYMREFYVYGFKSRDEYGMKSARSYDNERRRIESWLGDYMSFHQESSGKKVFLSMDSRRVPCNPLYKAFKAKSFTDKDITLHFYIIQSFTPRLRRSPNFPIGIYKKGKGSIRCLILSAIGVAMTLCSWSGGRKIFVFCERIWISIILIPALCPRVSIYRTSLWIKLHTIQGNTHWPMRWRLSARFHLIPTMP